MKGMNKAEATAFVASHHHVIDSEGNLHTEEDEHISDGSESSQDHPIISILNLSRAAKEKGHDHDKQEVKVQSTNDHGHQHEP